jgi:predicted nucleic-acid-binding protein
MLQCSIFELENRSFIYQALQRFKQVSANFSDYLIGTVAQHYGCS